MTGDVEERAESAIRSLSDGTMPFDGLDKGMSPPPLNGPGDEAFGR